MNRDQDIFKKRDRLAMVRGVVTHSVSGPAVDTAPYTMFLGNAILHIARLDAAVCTTADATVVVEGLTLDCDDCRRLALKFGDSLALAEPSVGGLGSSLQ